MNDLFLNFTSDCEERQKIIVSKDAGHQRKHIANNADLNRVSHYKIDGVVITEGPRCDFLLINEDKLSAYLIEIKGSDINKAVEQLAKTEEVLKDPLSAYKLNFRIIASKIRTHAIESVTFKRFKEKKKDAFKWKIEQMEEDI